MTNCSSEDTGASPPTRKAHGISPHSEEPVGHAQVAGPEDVDTAVAAARQASTTARGRG